MHMARCPSHGHDMACAYRSCPVARKTLVQFAACLAEVLHMRGLSPEPALAALQQYLRSLAEDHAQLLEKLSTPRNALDRTFDGARLDLQGVRAAPGLGTAVHGWVGRVGCAFRPGRNSSPGLDKLRTHADLILKIDSGAHAQAIRIGSLTLAALPSRMAPGAVDEAVRWREHLLQSHRTADQEALACLLASLQVRLLHWLLASAVFYCRGVSPTDFGPALLHAPCPSFCPDQAMLKPDAFMSTCAGSGQDSGRP